jgi:quinol monooxygenase YgiN
MSVIFIVVKFKVRDEFQDDWIRITREFTEATRSESGNLWFGWSRSTDDPAEYVLVEAFRDGQAGADHVNSEHFRQGLDVMRPALHETPRIIHTEIPGAEWARMGELEITP